MPRTRPIDLDDAPPPAGPPTAASGSLEALLQWALGAHRSGTLGDAPARPGRPRTALARRFLAPVFGTAGDRIDAGDVGRALPIFLRWSISTLRPDRAAEGTPIEREHWLDRTSWRPMLAVLCHFGFMEVPDFRDRYRRHPQESAADNLCGLWSVGPSTFYRYVDKGRRQIVERLRGRRLGAEQRLGLRQATEAALAGDAAGRVAAGTAWRRAQIERSLAVRDPASALWHALQTGESRDILGALHRSRAELARDDETDLLVRAWRRVATDAGTQFDACLEVAELHRHRGSEERERASLEEALAIAGAAADALLLGKIYGALGKFHESRDLHRALACVQDSVEYLSRAHARAGTEATPALTEEYIASLQKLAWLFLLNNDARSKTLLDRADALRTGLDVSGETIALLEQTWGEYWRRAGDMSLALEHKHRALNIFERLGDTRQILSTYNNLSMIYGEAKDPRRAVLYAQRVVDASARATVDPYILANAFINLGAAYFWQGQYGEAIERYERALAQSLAARLPVVANRARYNLAEALFKRFAQTGEPADERDGDEYLDAVMRAPAVEKDSWFDAALPALKAEILGPGQGFVHTRLESTEAQLHRAEFDEVARLRETLAVPRPADEQVHVLLAIASAYDRIAGRERETALRMIRDYDLDGATPTAAAELDDLTLSRDLTRERSLLARWKQQSRGLLGEDRLRAVVERLLDAGAINKSVYADLCQVSLATASKHLGCLKDLGLVSQVGNGPSTRYILP